MKILDKYALYNFVTDFGFAILGIATWKLTNNAWGLLLGIPSYFLWVVSLDCWAEKRFQKKYKDIKEIVGVILGAAGSLILLFALLFGLFSSFTSDSDQCNSGASRFNMCD